MNRLEFVRDIANRSGLSQKASDIALTALTESISEALIKGESLKIVGFGTFEPLTLNPTMRTNPKTKQKFLAEKKVKIKFKAGKYLIRRLNS